MNTSFVNTDRSIGIKNQFATFPTKINPSKERCSAVFSPYVEARVRLGCPNGAHLIF